MTGTAKFYRTVRAARSALALDTGFDPFISGGWGRCTKAKLANAGYVVDPKKVDELEKKHICERCQIEVEKEWDGMKYYYPTCCPAHRKWTFQCDNNHRWSMTEEEAKSSGHKCPKCGEYAV